MRHPFKQQRGSPEREGGGWEGPEGAGVGVLCHFQAEPPEETAPEGSYVPGVFAEQQGQYSELQGVNGGHTK